ncbi:MAG TPA: hypothetical protein VFM18_13150, partial [Methanosarcina sp.]|nr:hypothetical protein [Methanosarcina sp.]
MSNTNFSKGVSQPSFYSDGVVIEKDGSFRPSPLIYIPSNSYRFERLLSIYNASLDGTTDDAVAFQNALNALPTNKVNDIRIPEGVSSIKFNSGITFNVTYAYLRGMGVMFDFSGMTSGQAWTNIGGGTDNTYNQVMGGVERVKFYGPGRYSSVDGIISTGGSTASPNIGSARSGIYCSSVYNFRIGKIWFNRGYLTRLHDCEVHSNLLGYYSKGGAYDAYENVAAIGGAVYNNDMNIYVEDGYLTLNGTSIDYAEFVQIAIRAGFLQLDSCHIEYSIQNSNYGNAGAIYSNNAPMCAFDMQPGGTSALRTDIGLTSTTASSGQNWAAIKMNGGVWAVTPPRSGSVIDVDALSCHVNQAGNAQFTLTGNPKLLFNGYGTKSG